jgi:AcrR family transcriptional regulator
MRGGAKSRRTSPTTRPVDELSPRGRRTRSALIAAARRIFERDGFLDTRITDIAEDADVGHGTFYVYFESKEAILRAVVVQVHSDLMHPMTDLPRDPFGFVDDIVRYYLEIYRSNSRLLVEWERAAAVNAEFGTVQRELRDAYAAWTARGIQRLQREERADEHLDPPLAALMLTSMVTEFAHRWFADRRDIDFEHAVAQLGRICANALGLPPRDSLRPE